MRIPSWCSPRTHPQMNTLDQCWLLSVCLLQSLNPTEVLGGVVLQDEKVRGTATSPHIRCTATASSAYPGTITGPRNCGGTSLVVQTDLIGSLLPHPGGD